MGCRNEKLNGGTENGKEGNASGMEGQKMGWGDRKWDRRKENEMEGQKMGWRDRKGRGTFRNLSERGREG